MELKLLTGASQVRDHAREMGDWTEQHSDAIEAIGEALVGELGWEEGHVHQYLREIVESIDGLEYDVEG
jgi:predicted transcriptional regulator